MADSNKLKQGNTKIPLLKAQEWVKKWKDPKEGTDVKKKVDSYLIPVQNLAFVLAQGIDAARAYVGVNDKGEQTLMLVGTKYDKESDTYVDMIPGYKGCEGSDDGEGDPGIYDFSEPSPPNKADPDSPMNR